VSETDFTSSEEPLELHQLCRHYAIGGDNASAAEEEELLQGGGSYNPPGGNSNPQQELQQGPEELSMKSCGRLARVIGTLWEELLLVSKLHEAIVTKMVQTSTLPFYEQLEMKAVVELAKLELRGIGAQPRGFASMMRQLKDKEQQIEREAVAAAGVSFNLASPEQVSNVLYTRMNVPPPKNTSAKGKHFSTSEQDLKTRAAEFPIVQLILDYRTCRKITTTYDWRPFLFDSSFYTQQPQQQGATTTSVTTSVASSYSNAHNHVVASQMDHFSSSAPSPPEKEKVAASSFNFNVHPRWNLGFTRTGRLSCSSPNLQQVPKAFTVRGLEINVRSLFVPPGEDYVFVAADYSQIEMRVLACAAREQNLIDLFQHDNGHGGDGGANSDVYKLMASQIYGKSSPADVTAHERSVAKTISLGIIYGMGADQTAARLSIERAQAVQIIRKFYDLFPRISVWIAGVKSRVRANGYVQTMGRYRRYFPDITCDDPQKRATAERQSVNTVVQGSASEIIKLAMISMSEAIDGASEAYWLNLPRPELVATIHDELLYVFCSMFFLLFLFMMVSLSLLSIYCCLFAFSDMT
jgi:DNA polymerase-1